MYLPLPGEDGSGFRYYSLVLNNKYPFNPKLITQNEPNGPFI
jgi:hypothetical protein